MSGEMIERVAKAICGPDDPCRLDLARAAIEAMREPTSDMVAAANRNNHPRDEETWRTMVDAALYAQPKNV